MQKKQSGVIYLDRSGFAFYEKALPKILTFPFQPATVTNLDVLDKEILNTQIKEFISLNKIKPATLIIILSTGVLFEKILPETQEQQKLDEVKKFLENMPFENVSTITYKLEKGYRIIAMNRDFYDTIKRSFETEGFTIGAVIPVFSLGKDIDLSRGMSGETGKLILKKFESVRPENYVIHRDEKEETDENRIVTFGKKNKRLSVLLVVFALLFIALIAFIINGMTQKPNKNTTGIKNTTIPTSVATPTISLVETTASPSSTIQSEITIQILHGPSSLSRATELREKLLSLGYRNIEIGSSQTTTVANTLVVFSTKVANELQQSIVSELEALYGKIVAHQNDDTLFDVTITLAQ